VIEGADETIQILEGVVVDLELRNQGLIQEIGERRDEQTDLETEVAALKRVAAAESADADMWAGKLREADASVAEVLNVLNRSGYRYGFDPAVWEKIEQAVERARAAKVLDRSAPVPA
jgi:hypothetical protein